MPSWPELAQIDTEHGVQPGHTGFCDIDTLALFGWSDQPPIPQGISDIYTQLAGKVVIASSGKAQRLSLW
jgi:hypothetical protein